MLNNPQECKMRLIFGVSICLIMLGWSLSGSYPMDRREIAINSKCLVTILYSVYRFHRDVPDNGFVIDSQVQNCHNLRAERKTLVAGL